MDGFQSVYSDGPLKIVSRCKHACEILNAQVYANRVFPRIAGAHVRWVQKPFASWVKLMTTVEQIVKPIFDDRDQAKGGSKQLYLERHEHLYPHSMIRSNKQVTVDKGNSSPNRRSEMDDGNVHDLARQRKQVTGSNLV